MSFTIPESYVEQFSANVHMLSEQRMSRLRGSVDIEPTVIGESFSRERMGGIDAPNKITNIHGDTPLNNTPHSRRWGFMADFDVADLIDKQSQIKLLIDPASRYVMRHAGTMGRGVDDTIIDALGGSAAEGKRGLTLVPLPAAQKIASGATGMTIQKLIDTKEKLDAAEVDEFILRWFVCSTKQMSDLLGDDKITSNDFNTVKALVRGDVDQFMGFTFIRSERLKVNGSAERLCYGYASMGVTLGFGAEPSSVAAPRPDKRMSNQIYTFGSWGAVRVEDEMIVEVANVEV